MQAQDSREFAYHRVGSDEEMAGAAPPSFLARLNRRFGCRRQWKYWAIFGVTVVATLVVFNNYHPIGVTHLEKVPSSGVSALPPSSVKSSLKAPASTPTKDAANVKKPPDNDDTVPKDADVTENPGNDADAKDAGDVKEAPDDDAEDAKDDVDVKVAPVKDGTVVMKDASSQLPFRDVSLSWDQRLDDLMARLTLEEIVPQTQVSHCILLHSNLTDRTNVLEEWKWSL